MGNFTRRFQRRQKTDICGHSEAVCFLEHATQQKQFKIQTRNAKVTEYTDMFFPAN